MEKEQGLAGVTPQQAKVILREKVQQLIHQNILKILRDSQINAMKKILISKNIAILVWHFALQNKEMTCQFQKVS